MRRSSLFLLTSFLLQAGVEAAEIVVDTPVVLSAGVGLSARATNNDGGAVYDSMKWPLFTPLAQQLQGYGGNPSTYADANACGLDDIMDNGGFGSGGKRVGHLRGGARTNDRNKAHRRHPQYHL